MPLMALLVFLVGCESTNVSTIKELTVEFGNTISTNIKDYLDTEKMSEEDVETVKANGQLAIDPNDLVESKDYQKVGNYTVKISYDVKVNVKDIVAPKFVEFKANLGTYVNEKNDYSTLYKAEVLSEVVISVEDTNVDYSKAGTYAVIITAKDSYDNKETKEVSITVKEKPTPKSTEQTSTTNKSNTNSSISSNKSNASTSSSSNSSSSNQSVDKTPQGGTVRISATGSKYHSIPNCRRMNPNKASQASVSEAKSMGLSPCSKCM